MLRDKNFLLYIKELKKLRKFSCLGSSFADLDHNPDPEDPYVFDLRIRVHLSEIRIPDPFIIKQKL
jgi:hypothetical protein